MPNAAFFIGALLPTGVLAALFVWMPGRYIKGIFGRAIIGNLLALVVISIVGAYGMADGGPPKFADAFLAYLLPQLLWTAVWIFILKGRRNRPA